MSNSHNKKINIGNGAGLLLAWVYLFIAVSALEFLLVGVIAWKWGQKQTWAKNKGINGVLAVIVALALTVVSTTYIGTTIGAIVFGGSPFWFDKFVSGLLIINILLICIGVVILLIWCIKWLLKPLDQEKPQSPKEWLSDYLRN